MNLSQTKAYIRVLLMNFTQSNQTQTIHQGIRRKKYLMMKTLNQGL